MKELLEFLLTKDSNSNLQVARILLVYCQIGTNLFFALSLIGVWNYYYRVKKSLSDLGLIYLSLFFIFLIVHSIIQLDSPIYDTNFLPPAPNAPDQLTKTILSCLNSFFLSLSFTQFNVVRLKKIRFFTKEQWVLISVLLFSINVIGSALLNDNPKYFKYPDFINSLLLFSLLGYLLYKNFQYRKAIELSVLAVLVCGLIIANLVFWLLIPIYQPDAGFPEYFSPRVIFNFNSLILLSALGTIFLALAFTWVFEEFNADKHQMEIGGLEEKYKTLSNNLEQTKASLETSIGDSTHKQSKIDELIEANTKLEQKYFDLKAEIQKKEEELNEKALSLKNAETKISELSERLEKAPLISEELGDTIPKSVTILTAYHKDELKEKLQKGEFRKPDILKVRFDFGASVEEFDATDLGITKTGFLAFALFYPEGIGNDKFLKAASKGITTGSEMPVSKWTNYIQENLKKKMSGLNGKKLKMFEDVRVGEYKLIPVPEWGILNSK